LWFRFLRRESPLFCALLSSLAELRFYKSMHLFRITLMYSFNRANIFALMELNIKKRMEKKWNNSSNLALWRPCPLINST
jgi:hypothetical protein